MFKRLATSAAIILSACVADPSTREVSVVQGEQSSPLNLETSVLFGDGTGTDVTCIPSACCHIEGGCECCCHISGHCSCGCK